MEPVRFIRTFGLAICLTVLPIEKAALGSPSFSSPVNRHRLDVANAFISATENLAKLSKDLQAISVAENLRRNAIISYPYQDYLMTLQINAGTTQKNFRLVPILPEDESSQMIRQYMPKGAAAKYSVGIKVLWIWDRTLSEFWKALLGLHEGLHTMQSPSETPWAWCQCEYEAFNLQRRVLYGVSGPKYRKLMAKHVAELQAEYKKTSGITQSGDYDMRWNAIFGKPLNAEEQQNRQTLLSFSAIIEALQKILEPGKHKKDLEIYNFCKLYQKVGQDAMKQK